MKILKRVSEYTLDDIKRYCGDLDSKYYNQFLREIAIKIHEFELNRFVRKYDSNIPIKISGEVNIDKKCHTLVPRLLTLSKAFDEMITPDAQDFDINLGQSGNYYVCVIHSRGYNIFYFKLNDKNGKTTTCN